MRYLLFAFLLVCIVSPIWAMSASSWHHYQAQYGLKFSYPRTTYLQFDKKQHLIIVPIYYVKGYSFDYNQFYYTANVSIQSSAEVKNCYSGLKRFQGLKVINGTQWHTLQIQNVGMSHMMQGISYRLIHNQQCINITFSESGVMLYEVPRIKQIRAQAKKVGNKIIATLKL